MADRAMDSVTQLIARRRALAYAALLPLSVCAFLGLWWFCGQQQEGHGGLCFAVHRRMLGVCVWCGAIILVYVLAHAARLRKVRLLTFLPAVMPVLDVVACMQAILRGGATAKDTLGLLFHGPSAAAVVFAAQQSFVGHAALQLAHRCLRFVSIWYFVCCAGLYFWSGGHSAQQYPITNGPLESAVVAGLFLATACVCCANERIIPHSLRRIPVVGLGDIDTEKLLSPVPERSSVIDNEDESCSTSLPHGAACTPHAHASDSTTNGPSAADVRGATLPAADEPPPPSQSDSETEGAPLLADDAPGASLTSSHADSDGHALPPVDCERGVAAGRNLDRGWLHEQMLRLFWSDSPTLCNLPITPLFMETLVQRRWREMQDAAPPNIVETARAETMAGSVRRRPRAQRSIASSESTM